MKKKLLLVIKHILKAIIFFCMMAVLGISWAITFGTASLWSGGYRRSWSIWLVILSEISQNCIYCFGYGAGHFYSDGEICPGN